MRSRHCLEHTHTLFINSAHDDRFGVLASQGWPLHVMDDQGSIERCNQQQQAGHGVACADAAATSKSWQRVLSKKDDQPMLLARRRQHHQAQNSHQQEMVRLNRACIRRFVNVFFAFYRTLHLWDAKETVAGVPSDFDCGIRLHHIVAASDDFSRLSMYWDLMPAAKLNYVHDFSGFFNCISQVRGPMISIRTCCHVFLIEFCRR